MFGLTSQIRRVVVSVISNITEGNSRFSQKDKARFLSITYGSLMEVLSQLILASDLEYITIAELEQSKPLIHEVSNKLNSLRKKLLN